MELKSINLSKIPADPLVDFGLEVKGFVTDLGTATRFIQPAYGSFLSWHQKGVALREFSRKSHLTKEIEKQDTKTKHDYSVILSLISAAKYNSDPAIATAAGNLNEALNPFKGVNSKDRQARIGELAVIVDLFAGRCATDIATAGLTDQSAALTADLSLLESLITEKGYEEEVKPDYTFIDVKKGMNESFSALRTNVNGFITSEITSPEDKQKLTRFVAALNPRIAYYIQVYEPKKHAINLNSSQTTVEITTPLPLQITAGAEGLVQIKVRYATNTDEGTVKLREGFDYIKRYENNIAPNPNARVIVHGIGKYKGEQFATFEIRIAN